MAQLTVELTLKGITKSFGATAALAGVDLALRGGEVHALVGENGAGKSTLMKILSGAIRPDAGAMALDGAPYSPEGPREAHARGVAMIYQELSLLPNLTVAENIVLGDEPRNPLGFLARATIRARARKALALVGLESLDPSSRTGALPLPTQQLLEIARAASLGARVLVFDEPTSSLSRTEATRLFALIKRLRDEGLAIAYISHFLEELPALATRYTVLRDGRTVGSGDMAAITEPELVALMVGRELQTTAHLEPRVPGDTVLEARGPGEPLILRRGEVLGLAGLAGSGRTELLRAIFGLAPRADVDVTVLGSHEPGTPALRWSQGLGFVSEDRKLDGLALRLSIADNVALSRPLPPRARAAAARRWISELKVKSNDPWQPIGDLSGGNQQKIALARLLQHPCTVWLLDEPTRGIDVGSKAEIYALIDRLAREGHAVLLTSSDLLELLRVCDRIGVMARGRLAALKPTAEWTEHTLLEEAIA